MVAVAPALNQVGRQTVVIPEPARAQMLAHGEHIHFEPLDDRPHRKQCAVRQLEQRRERGGLGLNGKGSDFPGSGFMGLIRTDS